MGARSGWPRGGRVCASGSASESPAPRARVGRRRLFVHNDTGYCRATQKLCGWKIVKRYVQNQRDCLPTASQTPSPPPPSPPLMPPSPSAEMCRRVPGFKSCCIAMEPAGQGEGGGEEGGKVISPTPPPPPLIQPTNTPTLPSRALFLARPPLPPPG